MPKKIRKTNDPKKRRFLELLQQGNVDYVQFESEPKQTIARVYLRWRKKWNRRKHAKSPWKASGDSIPYQIDDKPILRCRYERPRKDIRKYNLGRRIWWIEGKEAVQ